MGTINLAALMTKIEQEKGDEEGMESLLQLCGFVKGTGYCTLVTGAAVLVQSSMKLFVMVLRNISDCSAVPIEPVATGALVVWGIYDAARHVFYPESEGGEVEVNTSLLEASRSWGCR